MRYAIATPDELAPVLGRIPAGWMEGREVMRVTDADGRPVADCVFADVLTGLVVVRKPAPQPGEFPLVCLNRRPPLAVEG